MYALKTEFASAFHFYNLSGDGSCIRLERTQKYFTKVGVSFGTQLGMNTVWAIGHSTRSLEEFIEILHSFQIAMLVDIRNYPGSRRYPHFNKEALQISLPVNGIQYLHLRELGGRRKPVENSKNTAWRNDAFRGYADYMQTNDFKKAIETLESIAAKQRTAYMCSEAVWWSCHRSLVSDYLKWKGWTVVHIMNVNKATEHPYTKPARIVDGVLRYDEPDLFS